MTQMALMSVLTVMVSASYFLEKSRLALSIINLASQLTNSKSLTTKNCCNRDSHGVERMYTLETK